MIGSKFLTILRYGSLEEVETFIKENRETLQAHNYIIDDVDMINEFCNQYQYYGVNRLFY